MPLPFIGFSGSKKNYAFLLNSRSNTERLDGCSRLFCLVILVGHLPPILTFLTKDTGYRKIRPDLYILRMTPWSLQELTYLHSH